MAFEIRYTDDPADVLAEVGGFLESEPVHCNLILSLLNARIANPQPGRYWVVRELGRVIGAAMQSPLDFHATSTPMGREASMALADAVARQGIGLPGFSAAATTSAAFAGQWAEQTHVAAHPGWAGRIYEFFPNSTGLTQGPTGELRRGTEKERDLIVEWIIGFHASASGPGTDPEVLADRMISQSRVVLWDDDGPKSFAGFARPVGGVARIGPVYTPPEFRNRGYAGACVSALTQDLSEKGLRCILYTDLNNPTSNSIYRKIGYRPFSEVIRFGFGEKR